MSIDVRTLVSDDGQPWFPRARRNADKKITVVNPANESDLSPFFSVRTIALLAITPPAQTTPAQTAPAAKTPHPPHAHPPPPP